MTTIDKEVWTEKELVINQYLHGSQALLKPRPGFTRPTRTQGNLDDSLRRMNVGLKPEAHQSLPHKARRHRSGARHVNHRCQAEFGLARLGHMAGSAVWSCVRDTRSVSGTLWSGEDARSLNLNGS